MRRSFAGSRIHLGRALAALSSLIAVANGCEKLVGTEGTVITRGEAGASTVSAGTAGLAGANEATDGGAAGSRTETGGSSGTAAMPAL